jgi:acyl-CoA thioesterase
MTADAQPASPIPAMETVTRMLATDAFSRWLGITLVSVRPGHCVLTMQVREDMVNGFGVSHGGVVFSFADSAMAFACNSGEFVTVAVDNQIAYPAAIHVRDILTATASEDAASGRLGFYRVTVRNQHDVVVALFRGSVYRTRRPHASAPPHE